MQFSVFDGDSMFICICRNKTDMYIKVINNCDVFEDVVKKEEKWSKCICVFFFLIEIRIMMMFALTYIYPYM